MTEALPALSPPSNGSRSAPSLLEPGRLVSGRYEIGGRIGEGGHGAVYRARHVSLELPVAVKVVALDGDREELVARFLREARTVARIRHRNVLDIHDAGALEDGSPYLVTELIEGGDLERRIAMGPLSIPAVVDLGRQLFSALAAIAEAGVVHRDVKPANLMLRREADGHVHMTLIDFGIARGRDEVARLTASGAIVGTPHYMSPEQLKGEPLDARADLYAACTVLYEALTGRPPFDGDTAPVVIGKILAADLPPLEPLRPDCPPDLRALIEQGLRRDRNERPAHPLEAFVLLDRIAHHAGLPVGAMAWHDDPMFGLSARVSGQRPICNAAAATLSPDEWMAEVIVPRSETSPFPLAIGRRRGSLLGRDGTRVGARRKAAVGGAVVIAAAAALALMLRSPDHASAAEASGDGAVAEAAVPTEEERTVMADRAAQLGLEALARGEIEAALGHYRAAVQLDADRAEAHRGRGLAAARAGFTDEAIMSFERYLVIAPEARDASRVRAHVRRLREERHETP